MSYITLKVIFRNYKLFYDNVDISDSGICLDRRDIHLIPLNKLIEQQKKITFIQNPKLLQNFKRKYI